MQTDLKMFALSCVCVSVLFQPVLLCAAALDRAAEQALKAPHHT